MNYGFVIPGGPVQNLPRFARLAEEAGWDAVFIPDCIYIEHSAGPAAIAFDPWVALAAMAVQTERVRLGTMITPLSRRRPWKVARETATLDHLSNGRLILPVGLGAKGGEFNKVYMDSFQRIVLRNEPVKDVLEAQAKALDTLMKDTGAPCWAPDKPSQGACAVQ